MIKERKISTRPARLSKPHSRSAPVKTNGRISKRFESAREQRYHVISRDSGWIVKRGGARRALGIFDTKDEAIRRAEEIVQSGKGSIVYIHGEDGKVLEVRPFDAYVTS